MPGLCRGAARFRAGQRVHVYLDVSGSMEAVKNALYGAVLDCQAFVHPTVHLFSTEVADISLAELRRGVCKSTGGTDIACVAAHMAANRVRRALLVTDGWVGKPHGQHLRTLAERETGRRLSGLRTQPAQTWPTVADYSATLVDRSLIMTRLSAAEFVFPGHPDKLCDAIADALVAEASRREPRALVGVEVAVHRNRVVRHRTHRLRRTRTTSMSSASCGTSTGPRDTATDGIPRPRKSWSTIDLCLGPLEEGEAEFRELSDDQAICIGYANNLPQTNHLPVEHWLARPLGATPSRAQKRAARIWPSGRTARSSC